MVEDHIVETAEDAAVEEYTDDDEESVPTDDSVKATVIEEVEKVEEVIPKIKKTQCVLPWATEDTTETVKDLVEATYEVADSDTTP